MASRHEKASIGIQIARRQVVKDYHPIDITLLVCLVSQKASLQADIRKPLLKFLPQQAEQLIHIGFDEYHVILSAEFDRPD